LKASLTKTVNGPLSQLSAPVTKYSIPMIIMGRLYDPRGASATG
jgi:hypothetical protein